MIILDGPVDGLEWFEAKIWKSMTFNYKDATSYLVLTLLLYVLGLGTGPQVGCTAIALRLNLSSATPPTPQA